MAALTLHQTLVRKVEQPAPGAGSRTRPISRGLPGYGADEAFPAGKIGELSSSKIKLGQALRHVQQELVYGRVAGDEVGVCCAAGHTQQVSGGEIVYVDPAGTTTPRGIDTEEDGAAVWGDRGERDPL
jgi:hypothetical protein